MRSLPLVGIIRMKETSDQKEKLNGAASNNISQSLNNNISMPQNTANIPAYPPHSHMFYYQPFRPNGPINPTGMYSHPPQPYGYINPFQQPIPIPVQMPYQPIYPGYAPMPLAPAPFTPQNIQTQNKPIIQSYQNQRPFSQVKNTPVIPKKTSHNTNPNSNQLNLKITSYNLDDPEELEKWKSERRKKFPTTVKKEEANKTEELTASETKSTEAKNLFCSEEEGAFSENENLDTEDSSCKDQFQPSSSNLKRKRSCKYFARGKCTKGDSCSFDHFSPTKNKRPNTSNASTSRPTIFENLIKIEEKQLMIKFYECIKLIIQK